jgi:hypothetical protein
MSLDRRIVSILYYNNIFDVNKVEEFIGEKNNFYEIKIGGKIKKLEIPSKEYNPENYFNDLNNVTFEKRTFIIPVSDISEQDAKESIKQLMKEYNDDIELNQFDIVVDDIKENKKLKATESFEKDLKNSEIEKKTILEKSKKSNPKISSKKIQIVDSKKIDDDLDDFINIL